MVAIVGGLGAASCWAIATLCSTRSSRAIGARSVIAWVMFIGLLTAGIPALLSRPVGPAGPGDVAILVLTGLCQVTGLLLTYAALSVGRVSIVAPIVSTEGAIAALIAVVGGEALSVPAAVTLGAIALGVVLSSIERAADAEGRVRVRHEDQRRAVILAVSAALIFGVALAASARAGAVFPAAWVVLSSRFIGTVGILVPLALHGSLRLTRAAVPLVIVAGVLEAVGTLLFVTGAQASLAVTAVLSSLFAALAAVGAFFFFHERLARVQLGGVLLVIAGVAVLAGVRG